MAEDASLDDFLDAGSEADDRETDASEDEGGQATDPADDTPEEPEEPAATDDAAPAVTEPGRSTFDWSPSGAECAACGAVVERRWRDGDGMVCEECKEW